MKSLFQFITESARTEKIDKAKKEIDSFNDKDQRTSAAHGEAMIHNLINAFRKEGNEFSGVPSHNEMKECMWLAYNPEFTDMIMWEPYRNSRLISWSIHLERKEAIVCGSIIYTLNELDEQLINNMNGKTNFIRIDI